MTTFAFRRMASLSVLGMAMVLYALLFGILSVHRHDTFGTAGNDLGNMDQAVWNTSQGRWFESTNWRGGTNRLGAHVEPILLPLALTYKVYSSPKTLLVLQSVLVALGAIPIFWLALRRLHSDWLALAFAGAYLMFPALQAAVLYEFHPLTLTAPFFALAVAGMLERKNALFIPGAVLAVACKEDMPLVTILMGAYILVFQRRWRTGAFTILVSLTWFVFAMFYVIPAFNPGGASPYLPRYRELGSSVPEIIFTAMTQPWRVLPLLATGDPAAYLMALFLPVGLLALLAPEVLVPIVPPLAANLLSNNVLQQVAETNHYPAPLVPFFIAAAIIGASRIQAFSKLWGATAVRLTTATLTIVVCVTALGYGRAHGFTPLAVDFEVNPSMPHYEIAERMIAMVPPDASVSATPQLNPHLTERKNIVVYPRGLDSDIVFLDTWPLNVPMVVEDQLKTVRGLMAKGYGLIAAEDGLLMLKRGERSTMKIEDSYRNMGGQTLAPITPVSVRFGDVLEMTGYELVPTPPSSPHLALSLKGKPQATASTRVFLLTGESADEPDPGSEIQLAGPTFLPPNEWPTNTTFRAMTPAFGRWRRPGIFTVFLVVTNGGSPWDPKARIPVTIEGGEQLLYASDNVLRLAVLQADGKVVRNVTPPRLSDLPNGVPSLSAELGDGVRLEGATVHGCELPDAAVPPCTIDVQLFWRADYRRSKDETVFVHLVGPDGQMVSQSDGPPDRGLRPTTSWLPGELIGDFHQIKVPSGIAPGTYHVITGLYSPATGQRVHEGTRDWVQAGTIQVGG